MTYSRLLTGLSFFNHNKKETAEAVPLFVYGLVVQIVFAVMRFDILSFDFLHLV